MAKHKGKKHSGPIRHPDMVMLPKGLGKPDPHASKEYHAANKKCGMNDGCSPADNSDDTGGDMQNQC